MVINTFDINTEDMSSDVTTRDFSVNGEDGAQFQIIALQADTLKYYDFILNDFELGHNDVNNNLNVTIEGGVFNSSITFPSGGGDYVIKLIAINGTTIANVLGGVIVENITKQAADVVVTFTPGTFANAATYTTLPTSTATGNVNSSASTTFDWDITNVSTDANGFGLRLNANEVLDVITLNDSYFYCTTTENVSSNPFGDAQDSDGCFVADVSDLGVGTELVYHKGTTAPANSSGASGTTLIAAIDTDKKFITFDKLVAFEDGETMTFKAYGATAIAEATGLKFTVSNVKLDDEYYAPDAAVGLTGGKLVTKTVRSGGSGTTINLNGTYGVGGGGHVSVLGLGVDNSSANTVQSVSASSTAGSVVVQVSQDLEVGTVLTFNAIYQTVSLTGSANVTVFPSANKTVYLDLDKIIIPGVAS